MSLFDPMQHVKFLHGYFRRGETEIRHFLQNLDNLKFDSNFPFMDVVERASVLFIYIELPGIELDDFTVYQYHDAVVVEGVRNRECLKDKVSYIRMERNCSNFRRIIRSSSFTNAFNRAAVLKDGVLTLEFVLNGQKIEIVEVEV